MPKLSDLKEKLYKSVALHVYGAPGVGKTELIGSAGSRNLIVTDMNGIVTLTGKGFRSRHGEVDPIIEVVENDDSPDRALAFDTVLNRIDAAIRDRKDEFDCISVDDIDFIRHSAMSKALNMNSATGRSKTKETGKSFKGFYLPTMADFGTEMSLMEHFIRDLVDLGKAYDKHIIVAAHERFVYRQDKKSDDKVLEKIVPHYTGSAAPEAINDYFDLVFRVTREGTAAQPAIEFQCHPTNQVAAKDRFGVFATRERNLTFPSILKRINES